MKIVLFSILLALSPLAALAGDTAYQALRAIGAQRNPELLNRVAEVRGRNGDPQPATWTLLLEDPKARGGVREIEVSGGVITSERTPVRPSERGNSMNFQKLNLDSAGAFTLAETEAKAAKAGFYSVDYALRCGGTERTPTWELTLQNAEGQNVGSVVIAADTGKILRTSFTTEVVTHTESGYRRFVKKGGFFGAVGRFGSAVGETIKHGGQAVGRTFNRTGTGLEEFFTGERKR